MSGSGENREPGIPAQVIQHLQTADTTPAGRFVSKRWMNGNVSGVRAY